jgi:hypothetical protein
MTELSQKTIDKYKSYIRLLKTKRNIDCDDENLDFDEIMDRLEDMSLSYKRTNLSAIKWYLESNNRCKKICKLISEEIHYMNNVSREEDKNGLFNDKQISKYIEWSEILKLHTDLSLKLKKSVFDYDNHIMYVVLSLYCLFSVRRVEDYSMMYIIDNMNDYYNDKINYYVYDESKFIFNIYKTKKNYGQQIFNVPYNLSKILDNYIKTFKIKGSLLDLNERGIARNIRNLFSEYFNIKMTVNDLRFSYLQYVKHNCNEEQIEKISKQMANSSLIYENNN